MGQNLPVSVGGWNKSKLKTQSMPSNNFPQRWFVSFKVDSSYLCLSVNVSDLSGFNCLFDWGGYQYQLFYLEAVSQTQIQQISD